VKAYPAENPFQNPQRHILSEIVANQPAFSSTIYKKLSFEQDAEKSSPGQYVLQENSNSKLVGVGQRDTGMLSKTVYELIYDSNSSLTFNITNYRSSTTSVLPYLSEDCTEDVPI
jgi:hypothetical protein